MKFNHIAIFLGIILSLTLAGCGSSGNEKIRSETKDTISQKIVQNVTSKAEIENMFGAPDSTTFTESGLEIWKYTLVKVKAKGVNFVPIVNIFAAGTNDTKKEITILFDEHDIVKKYTYAETEGESRSGVFAK
ncbi:hypothetical protein A9G13_06805 [Gilliamella sp. wkB178]|uniref:hypothetical protein n=1 Tax=Gilliamella sp. wkB178 TaxID=3120259 RepID=UPI00080E1B08|nr:hypothetical protein [Gilliamella apicola]OCG07912.1 hypothetical protein A9G13_06805 [Gilliamella apicola]